MLVQLFSETGLLKQTIRFNRGLNIIIGKYSPNRGKELNGIGKSSLIRLIDYAFLSHSSEKRFLQPKYDFLRKDNHSITLEFKVQDKTYLIKRTFEKSDPVLFGHNQGSLDVYTKPELKTILTNKMLPFADADIFFQGERYGTLMDFFIKDDLENQKRVDPLNFSDGTKKATGKAIFNLFLLGISTKDVIEYDKLNNEQNDVNKYSKGIEKKIKDEYDKSIEELKSERIKIEQRIDQLEQGLKNHRFLDNYKNIEQELIGLTSMINTLLKDYHSLNRRLIKIKESFQYSHTVNTSEIRTLYNEARETFGDIVSKKLSDIINFKKEILDNRNKFLIKKENELQKDIDIILEKISSLEQKRSSLYMILDEKGALTSIKNAYGELTSEKTKLATNLRIIRDYNELKEKAGDLQVSISKVKRSIIKELSNYESSIDELRALFLELLKSAIVIDEDKPNGFFDIATKPNTAKDKLPFQIKVEIPKADALGQSRLKIVAYDLMIFLKNIKEDRNLPRFLIHDGVYHGIELKTKIKALNYIYHQNLVYPEFQYIVTFNEDEIYIPEGIEGFDFDLKDVVVVELTDNPDEMLFKRDFE